MSLAGARDPYTDAWWAALERTMFDSGKYLDLWREPEYQTWVRNKGHTLQSRREAYERITTAGADDPRPT